ncbi:DUF4153 domain-containing protein [Streptomyces sp. NPDC058195]|uniref:DUF4153 domain-containing protein n=1 Tax=Streptomyces sp. NPDC058195 TaxID=3346375 RepID=UPI0036ED4734
MSDHTPPPGASDGPEPSGPPERGGAPERDMLAKAPSGSAGTSAASPGTGTGTARPGAIAGPPKIPAYAQAGGPQYPADPWQRPGPRPQPSALSKLRPAGPAVISAATLCCVAATAVLSALLLGDGLGVNALIVAVPAALGAFFAARTARRRLRPWTAFWALGGLALLAVPALRDAGWPVFLAVVSAIALGSLALHGSRSWLGVFLGSLGLLCAIADGLAWGGRGVRARMDGSQKRLGGVVRSAGVAVVLLVVFGALFASADAAFADVLGSLMPDVSVSDSPWRLLLFMTGLIGALAAGYAAAAPVRWDGITVRPGKARGRLEWALPLIVLNLLFAVFVAVQLTVLLGGYDKVMAETDLSYSAYARQGFWQLLWATVLTLLVIALALRWAPRGRSGDRTLVRAVLGALCLLTLTVVASALRRMDLYVDAYGLTRLRISVAAVELWLGVVILLIVAAGFFGARLLPRAVAASAAIGVLAFGLVSPDGLIAEQNVQRYRADHSIDIDYLRGLSADAVPALDALPEPLRSCALRDIEQSLNENDTAWYATSWGEARARDILRERSPHATAEACDPSRTGVGGGGRGGDESDPYDPY